MVPEGAAGPPGDTIEVTLELPATITAAEIAVVGDFNDWDPSVHHMVRAHDGTWRLSLALERGRRYRFGYLLDRSRWFVDGLAGRSMPTRSGGYHSVGP